MSFHDDLCAAIKSRLQAVDLKVDHLNVLRVTVSINPKTGLIERVILNPEFEFQRRQSAR